MNALGNCRRRKDRVSGHAIVETALMAPWIFFLFVGALDFGFFAYALITTQNAARVAALANGAAAAANQSQACSYVLQEMKKMPNAAQFSSTCASGPLVVQAAAVTDADGKDATRVTVTYQTIPLIPIPGLLTNQLNITRTATVRLYGGM